MWFLGRLDGKGFYFEWFCNVFLPLLALLPTHCCLTVLPPHRFLCQDRNYKYNAIYIFHLGAKTFKSYTTTVSFGRALAHFLKSQLCATCVLKIPISKNLNKYLIRRHLLDTTPFFKIIFLMYSNISNFFRTVFRYVK